MSIWNFVGIGTGVIFLVLFVCLYISNENVKEDIYELINKNKI